MDSDRGIGEITLASSSLSHPDLGSPTTAPSSPDVGPALSKSEHPDAPLLRPIPVKRSGEHSAIPLDQNQLPTPSRAVEPSEATVKLGTTPIAVHPVKPRNVRLHSATTLGSKASDLDSLVPPIPTFTGIDPGQTQSSSAPHKPSALHNGKKGDHKARTHSNTSIASRPLLNRYHSMPMHPMSPLRQHFRLHSPFPHLVKETPSIAFVEDARGRFINQYQITRVLGRGSFGVVYLAVDPQGQKYALKECSKRRLAKQNRAALMKLRRQLLAQQNEIGPHTNDAETSFAKYAHIDMNSLITHEIAVMKKLDHPNLVTLYEVLDNPSSESLILVIEWCPGGTIMPSEEEYTGQATPISEDQCRLYFRDLFLGVEYLHSRGVCHRDIKADNVLLGNNDVVKIADFGVSEIFDLTSNKSDDVVRPVGSPAYMSPELVMLKTSTSAFHNSLAPTDSPNSLSAMTRSACLTNSGNSTTSLTPNPTRASISGRRADIWGMGVTLYYMVKGKLPFEAGNLEGLHESILTTDPDLENLSPELADLLGKILEKNPTHRITLQEMREHPWITRHGLDPLLSEEENVLVTADDVITEDDLLDAIELIVNKDGHTALDYPSVSRSLRINHGWHGQATSSESSSGTRTPRLPDSTESSHESGTNAPMEMHNLSSLSPPNARNKMEKLTRALAEVLRLQDREELNE